MTSIAQQAQNTKPVRLKTERLEARVNADLKYLFQHAADLLGRSLTDFIINSLQEAATKVIREKEVLQLSKQDRKIFLNALLTPPSPNKKLIKAAKRHDKIIGDKH